MDRASETGNSPDDEVVEARYADGRLVDTLRPLDARMLAADGQGELIPLEDGGLMLLVPDPERRQCLSQASANSGLATRHYSPAPTHSKPHSPGPNSTVWTTVDAPAPAP